MPHAHLTPKQADRWLTDEATPVEVRIFTAKCNLCQTCERQRRIVFWLRVFRQVALEGKELKRKAREEAKKKNSPQ